MTFVPDGIYGKIKDDRLRELAIKYPELTEYIRSFIPKLTLTNEYLIIANVIEAKQEGLQLNGPYGRPAKDIKCLVMISNYFRIESVKIETVSGQTKAYNGNVGFLIRNQQFNLLSSCLIDIIRDFYNQFEFRFSELNNLEKPGIVIDKKINISAHDMSTDPSIINWCNVFTIIYNFNKMIYDASIKYKDGDKLVAENSNPDANKIIEDLNASLLATKANFDGWVKHYEEKITVLTSDKEKLIESCSQKDKQISELTNKGKELEDRYSCKICYTNEIDTIMATCHHSLCDNCLKTVVHQINGQYECPFCRTPNANVIHMYIS